MTRVHRSQSDIDSMATLNRNDVVQVHQKDLGVIIDNQHKFHTLTSDAVNKYNQILILGKNIFMHLDMVTVPLL